MEKIEVRVDKRIELMMICLRLSKYREKYPQLVYDFKNYPYLDDVYSHFNKYSNHNCIKILNKIIHELNFSYDAPIWLAQQINEAGDFEGYESYPYVDRLKKSELILQLIKEMKSFSKDSWFDEFFVKHKDFYNQEIKNFNETVNLSKVIPFMKKLKMDVKGKNFIVNLGLLISSIGVGGPGLVCTVNKPIDNCGNVKNSWSKDGDIYSSQAIFLHEFCHSIINPLTDKYFNQIKRFRTSKEDSVKLRDNAYTGDQTYINESFLRAIQICYIKSCGGGYQNFLNWNDSNGFRKEILLSLVDNIEKSMENEKSFEENFVQIANDSFNTTENEIKI